MREVWRRPRIRCTGFAGYPFGRAPRDGGSGGIILSRPKRPPYVLFMGINTLM